MKLITNHAGSEVLIAVNMKCVLLVVVAVVVVVVVVVVSNVAKKYDKPVCWRPNLRNAR
jgi:hypothetical protein